MRRVAVTGIGVVCSLGSGKDAFWSSLCEGRGGVSLITQMDTSDLTCRIGSEVADFDPSVYMDPKEAKRNDRYTHFAMAATRLALKDAGWSTPFPEPEKVGVLIGSGIGGMNTIEQQSRVLFEKGPRRVSPFMITSLISNMAGGIVAIDVGARGPNYGVVSACASGSHALGESLKAIQLGEADVMIAGGSEAAITRLGYAGFCSMKAMSTRNDDPATASRPFDKERDGFVMGEGAGVLILEEWESAKARGANILAELAGYSATCDAYHITAPDPEARGLSVALELAMKRAGVPLTDVDYINAHGTSTPFNDRVETAAIRKVFGSDADRLAVSSTKSMTGHLLGAAGGVEAAACVLALQHGVIPPTINLQNPDPDCDLDYVPNTAREKEIKVAISNNLGFGGHNACLVFKKA